VREPHWEVKELPATTAFERTDLVPKVVGFLSVADAMVLP
jgi:hypothetical protein